MQIESNIMLFSPPLAPIRLDTENFITIGRQAQCDLTLRHEDVSRRHSEIGFEEGRYIVRDLGSTNGTFLNGKEIVGTEPLSPGDRVEIGAQMITFCEIASDGPGMADTPDANQTIIAPRLESPSNAFAGDLSQIPTFAVMQVLEMGNKSGILEINTGEIQCKIWFRDGAPIHAESPGIEGFDAAVTVADAETGTFHFAPTAITRDATIECTVPQLLLESCRRTDEENNV
jgi:hypothetical protein